METNAIIKGKYRSSLLPWLGKLSLILIMVYQTPSAYAQTQQEHQKKKPSRAGTGEVISFHDVVLKPNVDPAAFEKWVTEYLNPTMEGLIPGVRAYITKADRGSKKGQYSYVIVFDSYKTRQAYYPEPGKRTEHYHKAYFEPNMYLFEEMSKFIDMEYFVQFTDWVVLR